MSVLLALGFTSTLLHYYFDGFIWKLRHPQNRESLGIPSDALARGAFANDPAASRRNVGERRSIPATLLRQALYFGVPLTIVSVGAFAALNGPGMNYVGYMLRGHVLFQEGREEEALQQARLAVDVDGVAAPARSTAGRNSGRRPHAKRRSRS